MDRIKDKQQIFEKYIIPAILLLWPLKQFNQGVDYIDSMYSAGNFVFFRQMEGTWVIATFLSNAIGHVFTLLPGGSLFIGLRIYTSLVISLTALIAYYFLKKRIPWYVVAVGEVIAINLCWCPTTILYNYLTYLFMLVGMILLYKGLTEERKSFLILAGVALGLNLFVRFPNVTETAFILAVWVYGAIKKKGFGKFATETLWCLLGYLGGVVICMSIIVLLYGADAYINMITSLFSMTGDNPQYKPTVMVMSIIRELVKGLRWPALMAAPAAVFTLAIKFAKEKYVGILRLCATGATLVMALVCMKLGMFTRNYTSYESILGPSVAFVIAAIILCIIGIFSKNVSADNKLALGLILLCIGITPLGSNNDLFPVYNNMFLVCPVILGIMWHYICKWKNSDTAFPATIMACLLVVILFIQSTGFGSSFVFRGQDRDTVRAVWFDTVGDNKTLNGMVTNGERVEAVDELRNYWNENKTEKVLLIGNIPGVSYFLNAPCALPTSWPDLGSYSYETYSKDMKELEFMIDEKGVELPAIIMNYGAYSVIADDKEAQEKYLEIRQEGEGYLDVMQKDPKYSDMGEFIKKYGYEMQLCNDKFVVYTASDNR